MTAERESFPSDEKFVWPDVPRLCFGPGDDQRLNADVSWVQARRDLYPYAEGYRRAAATLLESMPEWQQNPDFLVWPLAFLWRHHLELMLKDIISKGRELEGEDAGFPEHHHMMSLWREARPHVMRLGSEGAPELANVEAMIDEFERIDPGAMGFRYPMARNGAGSTLRNPPTCVNLRTLQTAMEGLSNFLDAVRDAMQIEFDGLCEMAAHYYG